MTGSPFLIGIGGAHSGSGKTPLAAALLKCLTGQAPDKPAGILSSRHWGAIKCTRTELYTSVTDDREILSLQGKDTEKMLTAGAEEVLWVQSPAEDLEDVLPSAVGRLSHLDGIMVEGNSAIEFLKPDIVIFLVGESRDRFKPSAHSLLKQADIIIERSDSDSFVLELLDSGNTAKIMQLSYFEGNTVDGLVKKMEDIVMEKKISGALKEKAVDGRIDCGTARKIATELNVPFREVGGIADGLKIRIKNCELGCF